MVKIIGNKELFAIGYSFFDSTRDTEIEMYLNGINILAYKKGNATYTTRWNLDDIVLWLRNFLDRFENDPYPVNTIGKYAAEKDITAREFDSDDDDEFDEYYDKLDEWNDRHRWHPSINGGIIADVYFQYADSNIEISWNNNDIYEDVEFETVTGGISIPAKIFKDTVNCFLAEYATHWFSV